MTDMDDDFVRLSNVVRETFNAAPSVNVVPETTSADIDGWDSLSHSILIMRVEEEFGIELPFEQVFDLKDIGALAESIRATRGEAP
jgi:acyl carrier protein